jgi:hypothetical protein
MPIKTPKERAFYYEITNLRDRLIYWIPEEDLKELTKNESVSDEILKDYPFGLDIEVYKELFDEFEKKYGLKLSIDVDNTWRAFQAVKTKYGKRFPRTGLINVHELENLAQNLKSEIEKKPEFKHMESLMIKKKEPDKKSFRQYQIQQRKTKKLMKKFKFKGIDIKDPIQEQNLFKVSMTGGENAIVTFSRLHKRKAARK